MRDTPQRRGVALGGLPGPTGAQVVVARVLGRAGAADDAEALPAGEEGGELKRVFERGRGEDEPAVAPDLVQEAAQEQRHVAAEVAAVRVGLVEDDETRLPQHLLDRGGNEVMVQLVGRRYQQVREGSTRRHELFRARGAGERGDGELRAEGTGQQRPDLPFLVLAQRLEGV